MSQSQNDSLCKLYAEHAKKLSQKDDDVKLIRNVLQSVFCIYKALALRLNLSTFMTTTHVCSRSTNCQPHSEMMLKNKGWLPRSHDILDKHVYLCTQGNVHVCNTKRFQFENVTKDYAFGNVKMLSRDLIEIVCPKRSVSIVLNLVGCSTVNSSAGECVCLISNQTKGYMQVETFIPGVKPTSDSLSDPYGLIANEYPVNCASHQTQHIKEKVLTQNTAQINQQLRRNVKPSSKRSVDDLDCDEDSDHERHLNEERKKRRLNAPEIAQSQPLTKGVLKGVDSKSNKTFNMKHLGNSFKEHLASQHSSRRPLSYYSTAKKKNVGVHKNRSNWSDGSVASRNSVNRHIGFTYQSIYDVKTENNVKNEVTNTVSFKGSGGFGLARSNKGGKRARRNYNTSINTSNSDYDDGINQRNMNRGTGCKKHIEKQSMLLMTEKLQRKLDKGEKRRKRHDEFRKIIDISNDNDTDNDDTTIPSESVRDSSLNLENSPDTTYSASVPVKNDILHIPQYSEDEKKCYDLLFHLFYSDVRTKICVQSDRFVKDKAQRAVKKYYTNTVARKDPFYTYTNFVDMFSTWVVTVKEHTKIKRTPKLPIDMNFVKFFIKYSQLQWKIISQSSYGRSLLQSAPNKRTLSTRGKTIRVRGRGGSSASGGRSKNMVSCISNRNVCLALLYLMRSNKWKVNGRVVIPYNYYIASHLPQIKDLEYYGENIKVITSCIVLIKTVYEKMAKNNESIPYDAIESIRMDKQAFNEPK